MDIWALPEITYPTKTVAYTGTAGTTTSWPKDASVTGVRVLCTTDAYVAVGDGVTATTASIGVAAGRVVTIGIPSNGLTFVVSAIQVSAGGNLVATPIAGV